MFQDQVFTGRRKSAIAQVKIVEGDGEVIVNGKPAAVYMQQIASAITSMEAPLRAVKLQKKCGIIVTVRGGGLTGQARSDPIGNCSSSLCVEALLPSIVKGEGSTNKRFSMQRTTKVRIEEGSQSPSILKTLNRMECGGSPVRLF